MKRILNIPEGVAIAIHAILFLAINKNKMVLSSEIKQHLDVSDSYLAKIMQRLVKVGFIESSRGIKGGYQLRNDTENVKLMDIYEAIEGPFNLKNKSYKMTLCNSYCILDKLANESDKLFTKYFSMTLSDIIKNIKT